MFFLDPGTIPVNQTFTKYHCVQFKPKMVSVLMDISFYASHVIFQDIFIRNTVIVSVVLFKRRAKLFQFFP